jgi:hypothetical protein
MNGLQWLVCALLSLQDGATSWIWFDSRESARGPELALIGADGRETPLPAMEDDLLISYLADRCWGSHAQLSIDRGDRNRVLLRFDLARGPDFERAELRFELHQSPLPTTTPLELAVHFVTGPWSEASTTWNDQPAYVEQPALTHLVGPEEGPVAVDVTPLARAWKDGASNHGVLLRVAHPLAVPGEPAVAAAATSRVDAELAALYRWAVTLEAALGEAERTERAVLVLVGAAFQPEELVEHERLLLATCLSHPEVRTVIERECIPLRLRVSPNDVAIAAESAPGEGPASPLAAFGLELPDIAPPALVVIRAGEAPRVLACMGVFDHVTVLRLVGAEGAPREARALDKAEAALAELEADARYGRAASLWARGEREQALEQLAELADDEESPLWAAKARFSSSAATRRSRRRAPGGARRSSCRPRSSTCSTRSSPTGAGPWATPRSRSAAKASACSAPTRCSSATSPRPSRGRTRGSSSTWRRARRRP